MGLIETEGLILKSYPMAEADKIVIILTHNEGVVRGVAKGAKRLKSRFGGGLEIFSVVQLTYFQKEERELVSISNIELLKSYFGTASDPHFLQKFSYLVDILLEFAPPHDPNEKLYRMVRACLETASENPLELESVALYFELWILRLGGYLPNWNICHSCKRELTPNETSSLQINFQMVCGKCQSSRNKWLVPPEQRKLFNAALKLSPQKFAAFSDKRPDDIKEVSAVLRRIIAHILGKQSVGEKILVAGL